MTMLPDALPRQFMNYVVQWDAVKQKWQKYPCLTTGEVVDAHNPANWTDHQTALAACHYDHTRSDVPYGVAFSLTANDPWFFLDLDGCKNPDGSWTAEATAIFMSFPGAMGEVSVSGTGLHVMGKANAETLRDRKRKWAGWLEFYTEGRFIAFGREGWDVIGGGAWNPEQDWTPTLQKVVPVRETLGDLPEGVDAAYTGPTDDTELLAKMQASTGGAAAAFGGKATVWQLFTADPILKTIYPDPSGNHDASAADAALIAHLAYWTGKDMPRMDRLFRQSALMREKWDVVHRNDGATYGQMTIEGGARMCNKVYDRPRPGSPAASVSDPSNPAHEVYMSVPEQIAHFEGCTYIRELHRIMTPDGSLLKPEQFKSYYGGHIFQMNPDGTQPEKNAFIAFTENRTHTFPKVRASVFDPSRAPGDILDDTVNTFFTVDVDIRAGDVSHFMDFLTRLLPDANDREIILAWMASAVQNPHRKFQWAPVLQGTEGNGKTFLMNCVAYAIGERYTHRPNPDELTEKFNEWVERSLFVLVEEIHMGGRREMLDSLKAKVTNEFLPIRGMQQAERMARNYSKWGFCTNHMDAVLKSVNDRRYAIFFTAQQTYQDIVRCGMSGDYFPNLYEWARSGGYAHIAHFLSTYAIPAHLDPAGLCHRAPTTSSTGTAIQKSLGVVEGEIMEATQDGTQGFRGGWISMYALGELIRRKNLRVGINKRGEILESLGYVRCADLPDGRASKAIVQEDMKRPILYVAPGTVTTPDAMEAYMTAQGYTGMPM